MYVVSEGIRLMLKNKIGDFSPAEIKVLNTYKTQIDTATKFIPGWVKVAVALALGMGTMVGWKRIVVTVGEKIGKDHLTYAQGACAELVAMGTIMAADNFGLPVIDYARAELRRGGNHGGEQEWIAVFHHPQYCHGMDIYIARGGSDFRGIVFPVPAIHGIRGDRPSGWVGEGVRHRWAPFFFARRHLRLPPRESDAASGTIQNGARVPVRRKIST